jgi:amidohydrolase
MMADRASTAVLDEADIGRLTDFRRALHAAPELPGEERATAAAVAAFLSALGPERLVTGLGGHGVAAVFEGRAPGPSVLFRSELDALPIHETGDIPHRSRMPGKAHLCGHDGHAATLCGLGLLLSRRRPARGRAILMFQPAEETGAGAAAVIADPAFAPLRPDISFSWHNMPGLPLGHVLLGEGVVNCASRGMLVRLSGRTSHASEPENGLSPMAALAALMPALTALSTDPRRNDGFAMATVTHARLGEPAFGVAPGEAELYVTLRTLTDGGMDALVAKAEALVRRHAEAAGLASSIDWRDVFAHVENAPPAVAALRKALAAEGLPFARGTLPMRASEDFGRFGQHAPAAMAFVGAGELMPALHNPDYDFPDALIPIMAGAMARVARNVLGTSP